MSSVIGLQQTRLIVTIYLAPMKYVVDTCIFNKLRDGKLQPV